MLLQNDPFEMFMPRRFGAAQPAMAMDAYRRGDDVWVHVDLPGVAAESIDLSIERSVLTITAERYRHSQEIDHPYLMERPTGSFRRQVHLGENLDTDNIEADYADGVLSLRVPVAADAKPRKVPITRKRDAIEVESRQS